MKALVEKAILMKKQEKEMRKALHFFYVHLSRELKGTQGNSHLCKERGWEIKIWQNARELKETQGNSRELKRTQGNSIYSREALVEVMEGK